MNAFLCWTLGAVVMLGVVSRGQTPGKGDESAGSAKEKLIGAWRLVSLEVPEADGRVNRIADLKGMLVYTGDGHVSVQLMYPKSAEGLTNDYVKNGYEASFGSYDVNEAAHTVTHRVEGSITEGLVGRALPRAFELSGGRLIIRPMRADEHWSVTWARY